MPRKRRGFGRLRQLPSGRWQAAYTGPDAKLHYAHRTFAAEIDAEGWLAQQRRKVDLGTWGAIERSDGVTLRAYTGKWIAQRQLRPRTRALYESMLERLILPELGDAKIVTLTPAKIREWHTGLGGEHPTRNAHAYALLHAICTTAVQDEVLDANPCRIRAAMQTKRRREVDILTPAQVDKLAAKMPAELRASVVLAAWCGLRWGETSELRRKDVADDCSVLRIRRGVTYRSGKFYVGEPKTAAGVRDVAVPPHIRPVLKAHLTKHVGRGGESLLFSGDNGNHLRADQYRTYWEKARTAIGKPNLRVHDLRHVGAVLAAQSGATTAELMHRLGHTTAEMALRYQHVAEGRDAEIAERLSKLAEGKIEVITRIYCSRSKQPHPIGAINADTHGLLLTYLGAVLTTPSDPTGVESPQDGLHYRRDGGEQELRRPVDEVLEIDLWCPACKTGHPVNAGALFNAAQRRQPNVTLTSRGRWDGLWK